WIDSEGDRGEPRSEFLDAARDRIGVDGRKRARHCIDPERCDAPSGSERIVVRDVEESPGGMYGHRARRKTSIEVLHARRPRIGVYGRERSGGGVDPERRDSAVASEDYRIRRVDKLPRRIHADRGGSAGAGAEILNAT